MKNLKYFGSGLFAILLFAVVAAAQTTSIKNVPANATYHSTDDGFDIALPANLVKRDTKENARDYSWEFNDSEIVVNVEESANPVKTDDDIAKFIADFKENKIKAEGGKILSETPAKIGEYRGSAFTVDDKGTKILIIELAWEKFKLSVMGITNSEDPAVQKAVLEAVRSFEFVH